MFILNVFPRSKRSRTPLVSHGKQLLILDLLLNHPELPNLFAV
jgi:hypothetical protein